MKIKIFGLLSVVLAIVLSLLLVSCDDESASDIDPDANMTGITTSQEFASDGVGGYKLVVNNAVTSINLETDLIAKITFEKSTSYELSDKKDFSAVVSGVINLNEGDNIVYLRVTDANNNTKDYPINIYRKKMLTVTIDTNGGTMQNNVIKVEEGQTISAPGVARVGYTLSWNFDFKQPITKDITIVAYWTPKAYKVTTDVDGVKTTYDVMYGDTLSSIPVPNKNGYKFDGWKFGNSEFTTANPYEYDRDIEIVASFELVKYNINYVLNGDAANNNPENPTSFDINSEPITLFAPSYDDNHRFVGWYTDVECTEGNKIEQITADMVGKDITLYAKWDAVSFVTFNPDGGECDTESKEIIYGSAYELPVPTKYHCIFDGWYNGETRVANTGTWTIAGNVELVAKWTPREENKVEYILGYPEASNNPNNPTGYIAEDGTIDLLDATYDEKHIFAGWYTNPNFTEDSKVTQLIPAMAEDDIVLYAKWTVISTVTFVTNCDTAIDPMDITVNTPYSFQALTKDGYSFAGWIDENGKPVSSSGDSWMYAYDVTVTAKWTTDEYKIEYVVNGGTVSGTYSDKYTVETDLDGIVIPTPEKQYSAFGGWYVDSELTQAFNVADLKNYQGITLYAKWNTIQVTINYDADGGNVSKESEIVNVGQDHILLNAEKPGYEFAGWYNGDELVDSDFCWTNQDVLVLNLKAKWNVKEYNITYELNGGVATGLVTKYNINTDDIVLPTPTRDGYYFLGWTVDGNSTNSSVIIKKGSAGDLSYTAVWLSQSDTNGFTYALVDGKLVVTGLDKEVGAWVLDGIKIPASIGGVEVVAIESQAFKAFGEKFKNTSYANMSSSYVIFSIPTTIKKVGANAFESCFGIKVSLYDPNQKYADYKTWDETVTWEKGNKSARDCIWGFRPAIGWTRYSKVTIPDGYDSKIPE